MSVTNDAPRGSSVLAGFWQKAELVRGMLLSAPGLDLGPLPPHTVISSDDEPLSSGFEALFGLDGVLYVAARLHVHI